MAANHRIALPRRPFLRQLLDMFFEHEGAFPREEEAPRKEEKQNLKGRSKAGDKKGQSKLSTVSLDARVFGQDMQNHFES